MAAWALLGNSLYLSLELHLRYLCFLQQAHVQSD